MLDFVGAQLLSAYMLQPLHTHELLGQWWVLGSSISQGALHKRAPFPELTAQPLECLPSRQASHMALNPEIVLNLR